MLRTVLIGCIIAIGFLQAITPHIQLDMAFPYADKQEIEYNGTTSEYNTALGHSFSLEVTVPVLNIVDAGIGYEYQFDREVDDEISDTTPRFRFMPVYMVISRNLFSEGNLNPGLIVHAGYAFLSANGDFEQGGDTAGGLYYAAGVGVTLYERLVISCLYRHLEGEVSVGDSETLLKDSTVEQNEIDARLGFRF